MGYWSRKNTLLAVKAQHGGDQGSARWELRLSMLGVKGQ